MADTIGKRKCFTCPELVHVHVQKNGYAWFHCPGCRCRVFAGSPQADRAIRADMTPAEVLAPPAAAPAPAADPAPAPAAKAKPKAGAFDTLIGQRQ